jgi:hypothetical protein
MRFQNKVLLIAIVVFLLPISLYAEEDYAILTGYDLYYSLSLEDSQDRSNEEFLKLMYTYGFIRASYDGIYALQNYYLQNLNPFDVALSKIMFLNLPSGAEVTNGQLYLIFMKYAKNFPEELNKSYFTCFYRSLIEAYGFKQK